MKDQPKKVSEVDKKEEKINNIPDPKQSETKAGADPARLGPDGKPMAREIGGREGPEPTRYGDWEKKGIISDF